MKEILFSLVFLAAVPFVRASEEFHDITFWEPIEITDDFTVTFSDSVTTRHCVIRVPFGESVHPLDDAVPGQTRIHLDNGWVGYWNGKIGYVKANGRYFYVKRWIDWMPELCPPWFPFLEFDVDAPASGHKTP